MFAGTPRKVPAGLCLGIGDFAGTAGTAGSFPAALSRARVRTRAPAHDALTDKVPAVPANPPLSCLTGAGTFGKSPQKVVAVAIAPSGAERTSP